MLKGEEEQLNKILDAVLNSGVFQKLRSEYDAKEDIEFYGVQRRRTSVELDLLEDFFEDDLENILKVEEIWKWLLHEIKSHIEWITYDVKEFVKEGLGFEMEGFVNEKLNCLQSELAEIYEERLDLEWRGLTPEEAKEKLPKNQLYIALLDKDGNLTREPFPITRNTDAKLTWKIETEKGKRNIIVNIKPPLANGTSGKVLRLKPNEVSATTIKT